MSVEPEYVNERIEIVPDVCNGKPVLRGTRITAQTMLEFLAPGDCIDDVLACMDYAAKLMGTRFQFYRLA